MTKTVFVGADHAGFELKQALLGVIESAGFTPVDLGTNSTDSVDYPDYAHQVAMKMQADPASFGLLVCGSGQGMVITANRHPHIRAALCTTAESARLARAHNNANVLCLGQRMTNEATAKSCLEAFLTTAFEGGRHAPRVEKMNKVNSVTNESKGAGSDDSTTQNTRSDQPANVC